MKKFCAVALLRSGLNGLIAAALRDKNTLTILCFHRISNEYSPAYPPLPVAVFEQLLDYVASHYDIIDINTISHAPVRPQVVLSFDDGYLDFYEYALPILKRKGFPFVISIIAGCAEQTMPLWTQQLNKSLETFINTGALLHYEDEKLEITTRNVARLAIRIYKEISILPEALRIKTLNDIYNQCPHQPDETPFMNWDEVKACALAGGELFNHTFSHVNLGLNASGQLLYEEIDCAKELIEKRTGMQVHGFTFPNSMYDDVSLNHVLLERDYRHVFLVEHDLNRLGNDNKLLKRLLISSTELSQNIVTIESYYRHIKHKFYWSKKADIPIAPIDVSSPKIRAGH
ncbi:polysaccharide deacetylase family protein [Chitinophagaceae bacterium MMS25-I14]